MKICAVLLAAGSGRRMKIDTNKVFIKFEEQSAVIRCLKTFHATGLFSDMIVTCKSEEREIVTRKVEKYISGEETVMICDGGSERQYSVMNALALVPQDADIVVVHDAARCFVTERIIRDCVSSAIRHGSGAVSYTHLDGGAASEH